MSSRFITRTWPCMVFRPQHLRPLATQEASSQTRKDFLALDGAAITIFPPWYNIPSIITGGGTSEMSSSSWTAQGRTSLPGKEIGSRKFGSLAAIMANLLIEVKFHSLAVSQGPPVYTNGFSTN